MHKKNVANTISIDLIILILKFFLRLTLGFKIANNTKIITKWKKNLPHTTWFNGIKAPRYFAVESWQTKIKKPTMHKVITLVIDLFLTKLII